MQLVYYIYVIHYNSNISLTTRLNELEECSDVVWVDWQWVISNQGRVVNYLSSFPQKELSRQNDFSKPYCNVCLIPLEHVNSGEGLRRGGYRVTFVATAGFNLSLEWIFPESCWQILGEFSFLNTHALKLFFQKNFLSPWLESNP